MTFNRKQYIKQWRAERDKKLGMNHTTASRKLLRMILFNILKKHGENVCCKCGLEIIDINRLSVEHKIPWLNNGIHLFWDLDNIAFSHIKCNISTYAPKRNKVPYGTKWCGRCKQYLPFEIYGNIKHSYCDKCNVKYNNTDKRKAKKKAYYEKNKKRLWSFTGVGTGNYQR